MILQPSDGGLLRWCFTTTPTEVEVAENEVIEPTDALQTDAPEIAAPSLAEIIEQFLLKPGDFLDPVDPNWEVDAAITDDGTLLIDGVHEFDPRRGCSSFRGDKHERLRVLGSPDRQRTHTVE